MLIGGPLVAVLWVLAPTLGALAAASLYVHIVADLYQDIRDVRAGTGSLN